VRKGAEILNANQHFDLFGRELTPESPSKNSPASRLATQVWVLLVLFPQALGERPHTACGPESGVAG